MRFFTLPPFLPEKSRLVSLSKKSPFYMQSPARPMGQSLLQISIGLSGLVTALCPSAIAAPLPASKKPLSNPVRQTLSTDSPEARLFSPEPFPAPSDSVIELTPKLTTSAQLSTQGSKDSLKQTIAPTKTQICQSLQDCDRAFTITINAASATALGDQLWASPGLKTDISEIETEVRVTESATDNHSALRREESYPEQVQPLNFKEKEDPAEKAGTEKKKTEIAGSLDSLIESKPRRSPQPQKDDELGTIIVNPLRSRGDEDLGVLRLLKRAAAPPKPKTPIAFLTARLGYFDSENAFRFDNRENENIYQSGLSFAAFPALSENTSLYAIAETNLGRFEQASDRGYNEVELQLGVRQKLFPRTYAQIGLRNQRFYSFGYEQQILGINYIDAVISHRSIFNSRTWLDSFYQSRLGFADAKRSSRFRQTLTLSLNYGINKDLRTSLLYQLDLEDYTQISRYDVYQQVIGTVSYRLTPESRLSVFAGTRFGNSSSSDPDLSGINLDDTFYGAGLTVNLPLF